MLVKAPVFRRQRCFDQIVRHFCQRHGIIRADTASPDFSAKAIQEDDRIIFGLVEFARRSGIKGRQGQGDHQHAADSKEGKAVAQDLDEETLDAANMENRHEVLEATIATPQPMPELVNGRIKPSVSCQHGAGFLTLLFGIERVLHQYSPRAIQICWSAAFATI
jgi:hypothetical protein